MKKFLVPLMVLSIIAAFYSESLEVPNRIATVLAFLVFMGCLAQFSSTVKSKNQEPEDDEARR